jgi:hypothetical protein
MKLQELIGHFQAARKHWRHHFQEKMLFDVFHGWKALGWHWIELISGQPRKRKLNIIKKIKINNPVQYPVTTKVQIHNISTGPIFSRWTLLLVRKRSNDLAANNQNYKQIFKFNH